METHPPFTKALYRDASDGALMLRVRRRDDQSAFEEIYNRYSRKLLDFFYGMGRESTLAEDLCHETMLRLWSLRERYEHVGSFPAYLFTIARFIWQENRRQQRKVWRLGRLLDFDEMSQAIPGAVQHEPGYAARRSEIQARLMGALQQLPDEQRMVFVMRNIDGLSLQDIADALGCPLNTVRSRKILAVRKLREALKDLLTV